MEETSQKLIDYAIRDGIREGVKAALSRTYNNPIEKMADEAIKSQSESIRSLVDEAIKSAIGDEDFRADVRQQTRSLLAKILVQRFGGELEKQVNVLKSDPATRARITLAIGEIVGANSPQHAV
jgi:hypothetical protein